MKLLQHINVPYTESDTVFKTHAAVESEELIHVEERSHPDRRTKIDGQDCKQPKNKAVPYCTFTLARDFSTYVSASRGATILNNV